MLSGNVVGLRKGWSYLFLGPTRPATSERTVKEGPNKNFIGQKMRRKSRPRPSILRKMKPGKEISEEKRKGCF